MSQSTFSAKVSENNIFKDIRIMAGFLAKSAKQLVSEFKRQSQGQSLPTSFTKC